MQPIELLTIVISFKSTYPSLKTMETAIEQKALLVPEKKGWRQ